MDGTRNDITTGGGGPAARRARGLLRRAGQGLRTNLPLAAAASAAWLSPVNTWWALPTAGAAFLAGRGPGSARTAVRLPAALLAAGAAVVAVVPEGHLLASRFVAVLVVAGMLPWFAGRFWRQYRELVRAGWERAEQLEREQRLIAGQARLRERARIAQDMHDALGHDLSLLALSAGALKLAPGLAEHHRAAAGEIRARASAAVDRLGEVVGVLREESYGAPAAPADSGVEQLVREASASGLDVGLRLEGEPGELHPAVERAVRRVVQEALTNVARHAPGAAADVCVSFWGDGVRVEVVNGPAPAPAAAAERLRGGGYGLVGLDERVRLAGGSLEHGPRDGGFAVVARLPRTPPAQPPHPAGALPHGPAGQVPRARRRARRRLGRTLAAAAVLPLVTGAVLTAALMGWHLVTAPRTVLDPADYARLEVGQDRSAAAALLPEHQTPYLPAGARATEPGGEGTSCEYYAMTADPFGDRSGDAYRLCFRRGTLVSLEVLVR
ncbi:sensor histidine kinase [Streptomyces thermolineatus]|uniref:sensor histidine kinase n=1 Tax=Streptomyces thermolineatus TaxID=44033 RepID=UPI00384AD317